MAISNFTEKLLFYTLQKTSVSNQLADIQMQQLGAAKAQASAQVAYNTKLQNLYYDDIVGYEANPEAYAQYLLEYQNAHEFEMATLNAWESQLDNRKESLETQLNEITEYEKTWQNMLKNNIRVEFSYGGSNGK